MVKKTDRQPGERNQYDLGRSGKEIRKKSRPLKDDVRVNTKPVMQLQAVNRQAVIQMAPYDDYLGHLQGVKRGDVVSLCGEIQQYIVSRMEYEEKRRNWDTDKKMALASLLKSALDISKKANTIKQTLQDDNEELMNILTALGKFVHVELSPDEIISLDDLSDILEQTRAMTDTEGNSTGEGSIEGKDRIRELGLLSVTVGEAQQKLVLMINGGGSLEGTGGSVAAPGESTFVFNENWQDVRFIAHTHPNESRFQTDEEFRADVGAAKRESEKHGGLKRAEMVRRDKITGGIGGTIFYTGDRVLSEKSGEQYIDRFAVRADNLNSILDENRKYFMDRLTDEQKGEYEQFVSTFADAITQKMRVRDEIADMLMRGTLSAAGFLELEHQLARLSTDNPEIFDKSRLREKFADEYWKNFSKHDTQEDDSGDIFGILGDDNIEFIIEEEDAE